MNIKLTIFFFCLLFNMSCNQKEINNNVINTSKETVKVDTFKGDFSKEDALLILEEDNNE